MDLPWLDVCVVRSKQETNHKVREADFKTTEQDKIGKVI